MKQIIASGFVGLLMTAAVACGSKTDADVSINREVGNNSSGKTIALEGSLGEVRVTAPSGPAGSMGSFSTVADIGYVVPCWAVLKEGFPKTSVELDRKTGVVTVSFQALAIDTRKPGQSSCRGLRLATLDDVFVGAGSIGKDQIVIKNLGVKDKLN